MCLELDNRYAAKMTDGSDSQKSDFIGAARRKFFRLKRRSGFWADRRQTVQTIRSQTGQALRAGYLFGWNVGVVFGLLDVRRSDIRLDRRWAPEIFSAETL